MTPFRAPDVLRQIRAPFPDAETFMAAVMKAESESRYGIIRLWLTEGIPFAFREHPWLYEAIRDFISLRFSKDLVHPKDVTLVGSGRIGFSMGGAGSFGRPFGPSSDLDLAIVSKRLFDRYVEDFNKWKDDYNCGRVQPKSAEGKYWPQNLKVVPNNIRDGFIDENKIPRRPEYPIACKGGQILYELRRKMAATPERPDVKNISFRVYEDWGSICRRLHFNLTRACGVQSATT